MCEINGDTSIRFHCHICHLSNISKSGIPDSIHTFTCMLKSLQVCTLLSTSGNYGFSSTYLRRPILNKLSLILSTADVARHVALRS